METIEFLQMKLDEQIACKARYSAKQQLGVLEVWEEVAMEQASNEIKHYAYTIACVNTLNKLKVA